MEDGPWLGCISPERSKRIESQVNKFRIARTCILSKVNLRFDVHAFPGCMCLKLFIGLNMWSKVNR